MDMRKMGILSAAIGAVLGLATLGCTGKAHHHVPIITADGVAPAQGKVGSLVVITGANFKTTWSVSFGGIPASFTLDSDHQITATVPANAISYPIELTNASGVADSTSPFIVMPSVTAPYTLISNPGVTPAVIRLAGSGFYDTSGVTVGGTACTFTYNDQNTLTVDVPAGLSGPIVVTASGIASTDAVPYP
jgi:large repetitive protein